MGRIAERGDRDRAPCRAGRAGAGADGAARLRQCPDRRGRRHRRAARTRRRSTRSLCAAGGSRRARGAAASSSRSAARLVMPVGEPDAVQTPGQGDPHAARRISSEEDLGAVRFVPLIGAHGWAGDRRRRAPAERALACRELHRRGRRAAARARRSRLRRGVRPLRRRPGGAARRGEPRHLRILSRAGGDHPAAGRAARLHHRRGRGRLAGRRQPSTATSATVRSGTGRRRPSSASRPGCGATPTSRRSSLAARAQRGPAARGDGRLLRPRPLQSRRLDPRRDRLPRRGRSRGGRGWRASATAACTPWSRDPASLRPAWR